MTYNKYIGLPYIPTGRTMDGVDCWGLVYLFYKNELNTEIPSYTEEYTGPGDIAIGMLISEYKEMHWDKQSTYEVGDVCVFNILGSPTHVGIYIGEDRFIHSRENKDVVIESLNNVKWNRRLEGVYKPSKVSRISSIGAPHPLRLGVYRDWTVAGTTVRDFATFVKDKYQISDTMSTQLRVVVDGKVVLQEDWDTTVLQEGQTIAYRSVAEGEGALRTLLMIAVVVAVAWAVGPAGLNLGGSLGTTLGIGAQAGSALATMGLTMAGMALVNAIVPIRPPPGVEDPGTARALDLFSGSSNQANTFGPIPVVLGKVRMTGMLGAVPYVETAPNTSLLNLLVIWGFGPLQIDNADLCIGASAISSFYSGTLSQEIPKYQTLSGYAGESTLEFIKFYPQQVEQKIAQLELVNNTTDGSPWKEVKLANRADSLGVTFNFPEGARAVNTKDGTVSTAIASIQVQIGRHDPSYPNTAVVWNDLSPYSIGSPSVAPSTLTGAALETWVMSNPNNGNYSYSITPKTISIGYDNDINAYQVITFAMAPGGGIEAFVGSLTSTYAGEVTETQINDNYQKSYGSLIESSSAYYSAAPKIPTDYKKIYTIATYTGQVVSTIAHIDSYSHSGLVLSTTPIYQGGQDQQFSGTTITITTGKLFQPTGQAVITGGAQLIFESRSFIGTGVNTGSEDITYSELLKAQSVWNTTSDTNASLSKSVVFPYTGYYSVEGSADDYGTLYIDDKVALAIPGFTETSSGLVYLESGTYVVRLEATSTAGKKAAACRISYTTNAGLNVQGTTSTQINFGSEGFFNKRKDAFTFNYRVSGLPKDFYAIRVRRATDDTSDVGDLHNYFKGYLFSVTGYAGKDINGVRIPPVINPPGCYLAQTALRIQSTNKVNGNIEGLNALVQTMCATWDTVTKLWSFNVPKATNNPAALFIYVLTHPANAYKVDSPELNINLSQLGDWYDYCNGNNVHNKTFTYNDIVTSTKSVMDILRDIAASGMASPTFIDGKWTVIIDRPRTYTTQLFTPHNSWGFEATKILPKIPDGFRITFPNEEKAYQTDEAYAYNYGKNISNARIFESLTLPGITRRDQAEWFGKWHLAQLKLRPEIYTLNADFEHLVCTRGDLVSVAHDVPKWGVGSSRISSLTTNSVKLTEEVFLETGKTYTILVRINAIENITRTLSVAVIVESGWYTEIPLIIRARFGTSTSTYNLENVEADNLCIINELTKTVQQLIVISVEPSSNASARLTLVDYSPEIYLAAATEDLLVYDPNITNINSAIVQNIIKYPPIITQVISDSNLSTEISTGNYQNSLMISFANPEGLNVKATRIQIQLISANSNFEDMASSENVFITKEEATATYSGLKTGGLYKIRARYTNADGNNVGPWSDIFYTNNLGKTTNTYTVATLELDLDGTYITANPTVDINKPADFKTYEYRLYKDTGVEDFWELDPIVNNILIVQSRTSGRFNLLDMPIPRISSSGITYRAACRALNNTNNYSAESALGTIVIKTIQ